MPLLTKKSGQMPLFTPSFSWVGEFVGFKIVARGAKCLLRPIILSTLFGTWHTPRKWLNGITTQARRTGYEL